MDTPIKEKKKGAPKKYVSVDQFNNILDIVGKIAESVSKLENKTQTPIEFKENKEIAEAKHNQAPINPAWEDKAREIIGEAVDYCDVFYPRSGGTIFTVVIKSEFSNAPKEYMERNKVDRRSREIGSEGISGVENWCKLIRQNLKRSQNK
jgi:hypothetical protein